MPAVLYASALEAIELMEKAGHKAMLAGGCVRDRLRGVEPKDYDIATTALPQETIRVFRRYGRKTVPTGIKHGTITYLSAQGPIEITTLRKDVETDGRHAKVAFSKDFAEDAARRDFTVNAMFADSHDQIHDYFQGQKDLQAGSLVFVGDPDQRIKEDYLRIMRLFRFWAQLDFTPTASALAATRRHSRGLKNISQERITSELLALVRGKKIVSVVQTMIQTGVFQVVLPEVKQPEALDFVAIADTADVEAEDRWLTQLEIFCATLSPQQVATTAKRLKLSNQQKNQLVTLVATVPSIKSLQRTRAAAMELIDTIEKQTHRDSFRQKFHSLWLLRQKKHGRDFALNLAYLLETEKKLAALRRSNVPIDGTLLMRTLGIKSGRVVGNLLAELKISYRNGEWQSQEEGLDLARKIYARSGKD